MSDAPVRVLFVCGDHAGEKGCPVSRVLNAKITMEAQLVS